MDVDLYEETDMNLLMIDSILELWQTKSLNSSIENDFCEVKKKIKDRVDVLIEAIRNLECTYLNHVQNLENDYKNKYLHLKGEIDKLNNLKHDYKKEKSQQNQEASSKNIEVDVKEIESLSEKIRSLSQNKVEFIPNQKFSIEIQSLGKLINPSNKYDEKKLNVINKSISNESHPFTNQISSIRDTNDDLNCDLISINQQSENLRKLNTSSIFTKPINLCISNNRYTGALLIPEHKYNKLTTTTTTTTAKATTSSTSSSSSSINSSINEYALFSISNRNCLKLVSFPEGRILRTYDSFISNDTKQKQTLKEPRGMCWNYDKTLIIVCDSSNNRLIVLKPIFNKKTNLTMQFSLDIEYLFEISDLTDLNINPQVNKSNWIDMNKLQYPASVCCDHDYTGDIFISDTFNNRIVCLNKDLNLVKNILVGSYNNPFSICLWKQKLIIADTYNNRVLIVSIIDGERERIIPCVKREHNNNNDDDDIIIDDDDGDVGDDDDDDDDDSLDCRKVKRKRLSSSSSSSELLSSTLSTNSSVESSTASSNDDSDNDDDNLNKQKKKRAFKKLKLKPGRFKRPYCVCVDANDRLYVLDWYKTDTKSNEECMKLSGRLQTFDLENNLQLLNYTKANNQLHLPNTMLILKNGSFLVCNVRHLTLFTQSSQYPYKLYKRRHKIRWRNVNNYSDDDDVILLSHT